MDSGGTEPPERVAFGLEPVGLRDGQRHFNQRRIELGSGAFFDLVNSLFKAPALSIRPVGSYGVDRVRDGKDPISRDI
jgi:hypothetical protein